MADYSNLKVLRVFLASPGDLVEERRGAKRVVDELNSVFCRQFDWHIELCGWEDTLPGSGRPQEIINRDVAICNLFVGVLWRRWGQPTGKFTSGFEEEFELARERRSEGSEPEIWLCFKEIEADQKKDPGEQLSRVLAFQQRQIDAREVLFKEFRTVEDWEREFRKWLLTYVGQLIKPSRAEAAIPPGQPTVSSESGGASPRAGNGEQESGCVPKQLIEAIDKVSAAVKRGEPYYQGLRGPSIEEFDAARLGLHSQTLSSLRFRTNLLDNQTLHVLYRHRRKLDTAYEERRLIFRTLIGDPYDLGAGWYWFRQQDGHDLESSGPSVSLPLLAATDPADQVRLRAYGLMDSASVSPDADFAGPMLEKALQEDDIVVRSAALDFVAKYATQEAAVAIEKAEAKADETTRQELSTVRLRIQARSEPVRLLTELVQASENAARKYVGYSADHRKYEVVLAELAKRPAAVGSDMLTRMLNAFDDMVREFAVRELSARGEISPEQEQPLPEDESAKVRLAALEHLIRRGATLPRERIDSIVKGSPDSSDPIESDDASRVKLALFRNMSADQLQPLIDRFSTDGALAYRAFGLEHFGLAGENVRRDLSDNFQTFFRSSTERLRASLADLPAGQVESLIASFKDTESFTQSRFTAAALAVLSAHGDPEDARFARPLLTQQEPEIQLEAVRILAEWGDKSDAAAMLTVAKGSRGELRRLAVEGVLKLNPSLVDALLAGDTELVGECLRRLSPSFRVCFRRGNWKPCSTNTPRKLPTTTTTLCAGSTAFFTPRNRSEAISERSSARSSSSRLWWARRLRGKAGNSSCYYRGRGRERL